MDKQDYEFGKQLFADGEPFEACLSSDQMDGYQDAAADAKAEANAKGMQADFGCMLEAQANGEDVQWAEYWKLVDRLSEQDYAHA